MCCSPVHSIQSYSDVHKVRNCCANTKQNGVQSDSAFVLLFCSILCQCQLSERSEEKGQLAEQVVSEQRERVVRFKSFGFAFISAGCKPASLTGCYATRPRPTEYK